MVGDRTESIEIQTEAVKRAITSLFKRYYKQGLGIIAMLGVPGVAQYVGLVLPAKEKAGVAIIEKVAMQDALAMTGAAWMDEIHAARAEVKADCDVRLVVLDAHWQARMDNHIHPERP